MMKREFKIFLMLIPFFVFCVMLIKLSEDHTADFIRRYCLTEHVPSPDLHADQARFEILSPSAGREQQFQDSLPDEAHQPWSERMLLANASQTTLYEETLPNTAPETLPNTAPTARPQRTSFSGAAYDLPSKEELMPDLNGYLAPQRPEIEDFLQEDMLAHPGRTTFLSRQLRTMPEIVNEAQRLHWTILGQALAGYKYAMMLDIAAFENKGDSCISVGEIFFLARIKLKVVFTCGVYRCTEKVLQKAGEKAKKYSPKDLVILVHGGGNIAGYPVLDEHRFIVFREFKNFKIFVFPQSTLVRSVYDTHFERCVKEYCCNENVTFVMRDHQSLSVAKKHFSGGTKFLMAPDMVFQLGPVPRTMAPVFDIMWIRRSDGESAGYNNLPSPPPGIRMHVSDWLDWQTPAAPSSLEKSHYQCHNGFFYLQRGRVLITDRLHGHILAMLMDIPHVLVDNTAHKLSAYHHSWTAGLENTVMTSDPSKAVGLAMELLKRYEKSLPPRVPFLHIDERHGWNKLFDKPEVSYP